jgi:hypothetical protein
MKFELPNAVAAMNNAVAAVGEDGDSWEIIGGDPLTKLVDEVVPGYNDKLDLKLKPSPGDKRAQICTVRWGKIEKDIARLTGLVAAIRNVSSVVRSGKDQIALDWKGEAFDAFRVSIEKVERTLDDYATAVETTASGMTTALSGIRQLFTSYRDDSLDQHLVFDKFSKPADWKRMTPDDANFFADRCTSHGGVLDSPVCFYNNDGLVPMIDRKLTNTRLRDQVEKWDCTGNPQVAAGQYKYLVESAYTERKSIQDKIGKWYDATDELERAVGEAFDAALENLRIIAELKVFSTFSVPGAAAPGGDPGASAGGDPGLGGGSPGPGGGGYPVDGGEVATPSPEPTPEPMPETDPAAVDQTTVDPNAADPNAADPNAADPAAVAGPETTDPATATPQTGETVEIKDGDHTISVSSPDGQGMVKVTVDDGSGTPKSYALDFDAASGLPQSPDAGAALDENVTQVPARTDGKCVIQDGDMTITAERPLFSPDSVTVTVDDGTGSPSTYTLDFPEDTDQGSPQSDPTAAGPAAPGSVTSPPETSTPSVDQPATTLDQPATTPDQPATATPDQSAGATDQSAGASGQPAAAQADSSGQPVTTDQTTNPQSLVGEQRGSLSGVLRSDQQDGEAGLASAPDAASPQSLGMVGAGMPMVGGSQGGDEGRAGSGWSVHGDLFDSGEPVYSMHGVLGDDDLESR